MARSRWLLAASLACATGLAASEASAAPAYDDDPGPWRRGTIMPSFGFSPGFGADIHQIGFGLGATYFAWHGLGIGLEVFDTVYVYRDHFKAQFENLHRTAPNNEVLLLPTLQYIFGRRLRVSPFVIAGLGPVFYNHQRGTVAQWLVGGGVYIKIWGPIALKIGINFSANFPEAKANNAFMGDPVPDPDTMTDPGPSPLYRCVFVDKPCSFSITPVIGPVFLFGGGQGKRDKKREEAPEPAPVNPMPEQQPEPEPAPEPEPESEPEPEETAPPEDAPPEDAPPEDAPPPPEETAPPPAEPPP